MSDKSCSTCVFFEPSNPPLALGRCGYPVPEWLSIQVGNYISLPHYEGKNCPTHKSKADLAENALQERG